MGYMCHHIKESQKEFGAVLLPMVAKVVSSLMDLKPLRARSNAVFWRKVDPEAKMEAVERWMLLEQLEERSGVKQ